jgi:RNA polymerase sigma-70 factor, ECF subfamily
MRRTQSVHDAEEAWIPNSWYGRSRATKGHLRASPWPLATGSMRWRTGSCATSTSPEDATQQALLAIWRDLPQLRDPARFEAWSYRLLVRACYAEGRRSRRGGPNLRMLPANEPAAADELSPVVDRDQLERGLRRLSIDHRAVVVMHHYLDLTLAEIADSLDVPEGTVRSRLHYAMRGLRAAMAADARRAPRGAAQ